MDADRSPLDETGAERLRRTVAQNFFHFFCQIVSVTLLEGMKRNEKGNQTC